MKRVLIAVLIIVAIATALLIFIFTRTPVCYIRGDFPPSYDFPRPERINTVWRLTEKDCGLVILSPAAEVPETGSLTVLIGREDPSADISLPVDDFILWSAALSDGVECILYEESDGKAVETAEKLCTADGNSYTLTYSSRISSSNADSILNGLENADRVFFLTPDSSIYLLRERDIPSVLDFRDAAALETTEYSYTVSVDINGTIRNILEGRPEIVYEFKEHVN